LDAALSRSLDSLSLSPTTNTTDEKHKVSKTNKKDATLLSKVASWQKAYERQKEKREKAERRAEEAERKVCELEGILALDKESNHMKTA